MGKMYRVDQAAYHDLPSFPKNVGVETTAHCNARCPFCPLFGPEAEMQRPKGIMSGALFDKVFRELKENWQHVQTIFFNVDGEPLIDPKLPARLELVKTLGMGQKINMQTNGQYLHDKHARAILEAGIGQITLGFDGATKEVYEQHRVNCDYDRVLANTRAFVSLRKSLGAKTRIAIQYVRTHHNAHEVVAAYALWKEILDPDRDLFFNTTSRNWATPRLDQGDYIIETLQSSSQEKVACPMLAGSLNVLFDGRVPVCCWDYNVDIVPGGVGDANQHSLAEIWRGQLLEELRQKHARLEFSDLPRCAGCTMTRKYQVESAQPTTIATRFGVAHTLQSTLQLKK
jgi:MoaA/NifB/PqqE/SkfB family radical SAM enzyme